MKTISFLVVSLAFSFSQNFTYASASCVLTEYKIMFAIRYELGNAEAKVKCRTGNPDFCSDEVQKQTGLKWVFEEMRKYEAASSSADCRKIREQCIADCNKVGAIAIDDLLCHEGCLQYG